MEAHEHLTQHPVDLLFLNIEMPLMNGPSFLRALKSPPKTILTTAYREYAYEDYELAVFDYLLKPFSYERFLKAVARAQPARRPRRGPRAGEGSPRPVEGAAPRHPVRGRL